MGVLRFRLRNEILMACRGIGWPLKKTENKINDEDKVVYLTQHNAELKAAA